MRYLIAILLSVFIIPFSVKGQKVNLDSGLVAYYPFNGNANDESGNGNNGIDSGATLTTDRFGNPNSAYSFNGVSDFITLNSNTKLNLDTSSRTFCAWIKTSSTSIQIIFSKEKRNLPETGYDFFINQFSSGPEMDIIVDWDFDYGLIFETTNYNISDNKWHIVISTYQSNGDINTYVDCKKITSYVSLGQPGVYDTDWPCSFEIGSRGDNDGYPTGADFWNGQLDDIRVYNRVLNESEIQVLSCGSALSNNLGKDTSFCKGSTIKLNAGNTGSKYIWNTGDTTQTISITNAGEYFITVTHGICSIKDSINVTVNPLSNINLGNDTTICAGNLLKLNAGNPGSAYIWNTGATTQTITVSTTGKYLVTVSDKNCSIKDSINVSIGSPPKVNLGKDTTICEGNLLILNAGNSGSNYIWNTGATTQSITVSKPGIYLVTVSNGSCSGTGSIYVSVNTLLQVDLGKDTTICKGSSLTVNAGNPGSKYIWNTGVTTQTITVSKPGIYLVTVSNRSCSGTGSINVSVDSPPPVNLGKDTTICSGCSITLNAGNGFKEYKWQDGSNGSTYTVTTSGTYWVSVTDQYGCKYCDTIIVKEECDGQELFVPNAFTPNGDNINDVFKVVAPPCITNLNMKIYNRWGTLLFETNDINEGWNGKFRNENVPEGVYIYIITYYNVSNSSSKLHKNGTVTLLR